MAPVDEQLFVLMSGVEYGDEGLRRAFEAELRELLEEDRPLRVYLGIDPTATSLTLGTRGATAQAAAVPGLSGTRPCS